MPTYRFLGEFVTLIIRVGQGVRNRLPVRGSLRETHHQIVRGSREKLPDIVDLLNRDLRTFQFATVWSAQELEPEDFRVVYSPDGTPVACAAIWDQRAFKQTVVRGYSTGLRMVRPLINFGASLLSRPVLPRIGEPVSHAFVSHLAVDPLRPVLLERLVRDLYETGYERNLDYFTLGFDARDPRLTRLRRVFRAREYVSRLYVVHWDNGAELAEDLDDRLLAPEVALL